MSTALRELCILSVIGGAAMSLMPEGGVKRVAGMLLPCIMIIVLISPLKDLDYESYAIYMAKYSQMSDGLLKTSAELNKNLNRLVIEEQCEAYILDKAIEKGVELYKAEVSAQWSTEGCWVPYCAVLYGKADSAERAIFEELITAQLGIPSGRQEWKEDE